MGGRCGRVCRPRRQEVGREEEVVRVCVGGGEEGEEWVGWCVVEESEGEGRRRREKSKTNEKQKTGGIWSCNSRKKYTRIDDGTGTAWGMHFVVSKRRRSCRRCG